MMAKKTKRVITTSYEIFKISEDGLLKEPLDQWGEKLFYFNKYDTEEGAINTILAEGREYTEYAIIKKVCVEKEQQ